MQTVYVVIMFRALFTYDILALLMDGRRLRGVNKASTSAMCSSLGDCSLSTSKRKKMNGSACDPAYDFFSDIDLIKVTIFFPFPMTNTD